MADEVVMVAVCRHSSSLAAVKWAIDNNFHVPGGGVLKLVHVRPPVRFIPDPLGNLVPINKLNPWIVAAYKRDVQSKTDQELQAHRSLCDARQVRAEFIIVESDKIALSILDQVCRLNVKKLIIGTSTGNALFRKMKRDGIADYVVRNAPEHCSIFVVSKEKLLSVKEARLSSAASINMLSNCNPNDEKKRRNSLSSNSDDSILTGEFLEEHLQHLDPRKLHEDGRGVITQSLPLQRARAASSINFMHGQYDKQSFSESQRSLSNTSRYQTTSMNDSYNADDATSKSFMHLRIPSVEKICLDEHSQDTTNHKEIHASAKLDDNHKILDRSISEVSSTHFSEKLNSILICNSIHGQSVESITQISNDSEHDSKEKYVTKMPLDISRLQRVISIQDEELNELEKLKLELEVAQQRVVKAEQATALAMQRAAELNTLAKKEEKKREQALLLAKASRQEAAEESRKYDEILMALEAAKLAAEDEAARRKEAEVRANNEALNRQEALAALQLAKTKYRKYEYEELSQATDGFSDSNQIGVGGYGPVFKGKLHHTTVAIKALKHDAVQGPKEFQQEIELLSRMHHPHLVLLLGACPEKGCLVYEYLANGSLEDRLFCKGATPPLAWHTRFRIAAEVATALLFLHSAKPNPYVHRDLKPANILLDRNMISKLGDVGLARLAPGNISDSVTYYRDTTPVGTYAYIDPEYQRTGVFTPKSDVYAFGLVMLQLLTGKSPTGLIKCIENAVEQNKLSEVLDPTAGNWPINEATEMALLAIECSELKRKSRPELNTVLPKLDKLRTFADDYLVQVAWNKESVNDGQRGVIPSFFQCPISKEIMGEPHIAADGFTYEYGRIKQWLQDHKTSPMTNLKLKHKQLTPNHALRLAIQEWKQRMVFESA